MLCSPGSTRWKADTMAAPGEMRDPAGAPTTTVRLQNIAQSYGQSAALMAAVEIGLFTAISKGAGSYAEVAEAVDIHPTNAERLMVMLCAAGLLEKSEGRHRNAADVTDGCPSHDQRLQTAARRLDRHRNDLGAKPRRAQQHARVHQRRRQACRAVERRAAWFPAGATKSHSAGDAAAMATFRSALDRARAGS